MTPIQITAKLGSAMSLPGAPIALDALLMSAVSTRDNLPPLALVPSGERVEIEIPIAKDRGIYLCSTGIATREVHERRWLNRRFPVAEAQMFGAAKVRRINLSAGACKSYRIPTETVHFVDDEMSWFAAGNRDEVESLLMWVHYLGKKRSVGLGRVLSWTVTDVEPWPGFPVLREGRPLRALPLDWPGLGEHRRELRVLNPPYWERWREQECAV